jgi:hypothetical protein
MHKTTALRASPWAAVDSPETHVVAEGAQPPTDGVPDVEAGPNSDAESDSGNMAPRGRLSPRIEAAPLQRDDQGSGLEVGPQDENAGRTDHLCSRPIMRDAEWSTFAMRGRVYIGAESVGLGAQAVVDAALRFATNQSDSTSRFAGFAVGALLRHAMVEILGEREKTFAHHAVSLTQPAGGLNPARFQELVAGAFDAAAAMIPIAAGKAVEPFIRKAMDETSMDGKSKEFCTVLLVALFTRSLSVITSTMSDVASTKTKRALAHTSTQVPEGAEFNFRNMGAGMMARFGINFGALTAVRARAAFSPQPNDDATLLLTCLCITGWIVAKTEIYNCFKARSVVPAAENREENVATI